MNKLTIRKANIGDLKFYFDLRNEPSVRASAFNSKKNSLRSHTDWFLRKIKDPRSRLLVIEENGRPAGQVRIDVEGTAGEVSVAVLPEFRGRGYGTFGIKEACREIFAEFTGVKKIFAHIKKDNISSQRTFAAAGFRDNGPANYEGCECIEMILEKPFGFNGKYKYMKILLLGSQNQESKMTFYFP